MLFFKKEYSVPCQYFALPGQLGPWVNHLLGRVLYVTHYQQTKFIQTLHFPPSEGIAHFPETSNSLQYSCLGNPKGRGAWRPTVHGVVKSWTPLSNFTFTFHFHVLEKEMATHSSVLAWRIPGTGEPGGLGSVGSHRVRHD